MSPTKFSQIPVNEDCNEDFNEDCIEDFNKDCNKDCMANCMATCKAMATCEAISWIGIALLVFGFLIYFCISLALKTSKSMEFIIADASIKQFNLTSDNILYYNFKLNITVSNPDYADYKPDIAITAISSYKGNKIAMVDMESFAQDSKKTILKPVVFYGNSLINLDAQQLVEYHNETRLGIFNLDLKLDLKYNHYVYCIGLRVPSITNEKLESTFNIIKCSREYQGWG